jgi:hypothetical protein
MMKKHFLILALSLISIISYSQVKIPVGTKTDLNKFLKSKTYVVLKNDRMSDYNTAMKDAVEKHWTITPYEFIYESDFNKMKNDAGKSFLMINQVYFEKDKSQTLFDFLILTIGGSYKTVNDMPTLCAVPLCYNGAQESDYDYKLGLIVKFVQKHITTTSENSSLTEDNLAEYYMSKSGSPKKKTFYLLKEEVEPEIRTKNSFATAYPYNFVYSTREEIAKLIDNNDESGIILHLIGPQMNSILSYCVKIIIDTKEGNIFYYEMDKMTEKNPDLLLKSDLKKLANKE